MDFDQVRHGVFAAYAEGAYLNGVELIVRARPDHPDRHEILTFWEACLSSMGGDPDRALEVLTAGLERGMAWHSRMLADADLDAARKLDDWSEFEARSQARMATLESSRPGTFTRVAADPVGTIVALHGAGEVPADFFDRWSAAAPDDWTLIAPVGDVPRSNGRWAWPFDLSTDSLLESLHDQPLQEPLVMAGYSQGGRLAAEASWDGKLAVSGLILVASGLTVEAWHESQKRPTSLYLIVGTEDDISYEPCLATVAALRDDGVPVRLEVRDGLGHEPPADLDQVVRRGLDFIQRNGPPDGRTDP